MKKPLSLFVKWLTFGEIIGDYQYPENPSEQFRSALESDVSNRGLPMKIGGVEKVEFDSREYSQIKIEFTDDNEKSTALYHLFRRNLCGAFWQKTGQKHKIEEVIFQIK